MRSPRFNRREAAFLARAASERRVVTYGEFAKEFGRANQGCGQILTEMGERLRQEKLPLLPVLVVNKETGVPSEDADFYRRLGLDRDGIEQEQQNCFEHDWTHAPFWSDE